MWALYRPEFVCHHSGSRPGVEGVVVMSSFSPDSLEKDSLNLFFSPPALLRETEDFAISPAFWRQALDSLFIPSHHNVPLKSLEAEAFRKLDQQLLVPDYRAQSFLLPEKKTVYHSGQLAWALLAVVFILGLIRWIETEKFNTFFRAFFSAKPVPGIMRDRYVFPAPGFLFVTASLLFVLSLSWIPFIDDTLWQHRRGFLLWLLGGLMVYVYWLVKHLIIRLWGVLMDDRDLPACHILFSSQGLALGGLAGLISGVILLSGGAETWQRTYWVAGSFGVPPLWTLVRTLASVPFRQPIRFFYNLYYLCTLEILPLLGLWNRVPDFPSFWPAL